MDDCCFGAVGGMASYCGGKGEGMVGCCAGAGGGMVVCCAGPGAMFAFGDEAGGPACHVVNCGSY